MTNKQIPKNINCCQIKIKQQTITKGESVRNINRENIYKGWLDNVPVEIKQTYLPPGQKGDVAGNDRGKKEILPSGMLGGEILCQILNLDTGKGKSI
jgi:hypothetical protein